MNICFVTESFYPEIDGGAVHSRLLAERFREAGKDVLIITRRPNVSYAREELVSGIRVKRVGLDDRYGMLGRYLGVFTILPPLIRYRNQYDVVLVAAPRILGAPVLVLMKLLGKKCVMKPDSCGEMDGSYALDQTAAGGLKHMIARAYFGIRNQFLKRADAYVAISKVLVDEMLQMGISEELIHKIPNGVDTDRFRPLGGEEKALQRARLGLPEKAIVYSYCGRLTREKGLHSLLRAWKCLCDREANIHLLLVGTGKGMSLDCESDLKSYVSENRLDDFVTFSGGVDDVSKYIGCTDVFVLPSLTEALGIALIESQLTGLPAVATRVGGIPDVVDDGVNGVLVEPNDDRELLEAMAQLVSDGEKRITMGRQARVAAVERFSISSVTSKYLSLLESVSCKNAVKQRA